MRRKVFPILLTLLVLLCASGNLNATCPTGQPKARVIYVNGINTAESSAQLEVGDINDRFRAYAMAKGISRDPDCVDFVLSYNDTRGFWHDLTVDSLLESLHPGISKFWTWVEVDTATVDIKTSISTAVSLIPFAKKLVYDTELSRLIQNIQDAWTAQRTAVLFVHSEGNYYANYAYQYFKSQGIKLPDPQKLVIVSLASPTGNLLDGRNTYVKTCTDLIRLVFGSLPYNYNEPAGCSIQFPVVTSDSLVNNIYNELVSVLTANPQKIPGDHLMGHYLEANSALNGQVMQLLNSSLPDGNCYTASCTWNSPLLNSWEWDSTTINGAADPAFNGGLVNLTVESALPRVGGGPINVSSNVKSLRQFSDNFTLQVKFLHGGTGASQIRLDRATDNTTAAGFSIYPLSGFVYASVFSSTTNQVLTSTPNITNKVVTLTFTATGGKVKISLTDPSGTQQIGELPWDNTGSYRLVAQSLIGPSYQLQRNVLSLNSVLADRTDVPLVPPPQTLTPICSANPPAVTLGQSTVFTGSYSGGTPPVTGVWSGPFTGNTPSATYKYAPGVGAGIASSVKATYTVTDNGNPKQTASTTCSVQINPPAPLVPTIGNIQTLNPIANTPFDLTVTNATNIVASQIQAWVFDSSLCVNGCRHPNSGVINVTANGLTMHNVQLDAGDHYIKLRNTDNGAWSNASASFTIAPTPYTLTLTSIQTSPNPAVVGIVRITATGSNITSTTTMELTGPYCAPCAPNAKVSQNGTILVYDAQLNNPGTFTVKLRDGSQLTAGKDFVVSAPVTIGTVGIATTNNVSLTCQLNGVTVNAPSTITNQPAGNQTLSCTAPSGYTISSISPAASQALAAGETKVFTVNLAAIATTGTIRVVVNMNGQAYSGQMACGFLNSPSNFSVNSVPFSQNNLPLGTYNFNCAGGPPNSQLQSFSPSSSLTLGAGQTITFTVNYVWATVTVYANPLQAPPPGTYWTWNVTGGTWYYNGTWGSKPVLTINSTAYTFDHPAGYIEAYKQIKGWGGSGPLDSLIAYWQANLQYWPPYVVVSLGPSAPTVSSYYWNNTPKNNELFSGNSSGTGFVSGNTAVYFCINNTSTCYQHPAAGVAVNSTISLSVYNVKLTTGYWQEKVVTPYGTGIGPAFYVQ